MHFNENSNRAQAETLGGEKRFKISFPKYKQGGYAVRQVKVDQTFSELHQFTTPLQQYIYMHCSIHSHIDYVDSLLEEAITLCLSEEVQQSRSEIPPSLCSKYERPAKADAIEEHRTRFNSQ